jgi:CheY-like chemotaxis protein
VLIADDDELFAALLAARFRTTGMSPVVVTDGLEVLLQVARRPPDLILLDVQMPFADGLCIARKLAQHPELIRCPVIVVTARTDSATMRACEALSALHLPKGPRLWERLQRLIEEAGPLGPASRRVQPAAVPIAAQPDGRGRRARVVLADDDPLFLDHLASRLRTCGIDVATASSGTQAYTLVLKHSPDVVISDYAMPDGDGSFVLARIRANILTSDIPVLIVTGLTRQDRPNHALVRELRGRGGAVEILPKPVPVGTLLDTLRRLGVPLPG